MNLHPTIAPMVANSSTQVHLFLTAVIDTFSSVKLLYIFLVVMLLLGGAFGQVEIRLPKTEFRNHEQIDVSVVNETKHPISFCVEFGYQSYTSEGTAASTPTPVLSQRKVNSTWSTLINGADLGSARNSVVLASGQSQNYPLRINATGTLRLVLEYWAGENDKVCQSPKGKRIVYSKTFEQK